MHRLGKNELGTLKVKPPRPRVFSSVPPGAAANTATVQPFRFCSVFLQTPAFRSGAEKPVLTYDISRRMMWFLPPASTHRGWDQVQTRAKLIPDTGQSVILFSFPRLSETLERPFPLQLSSPCFYSGMCESSGRAFPSRGLLLRAAGIWAHVSLFVSHVFPGRLIRADIT